MISSLELARLCGVSQGTVDRALHGRPGIAEKTKARILKIAEKHGYQANPVATEMMQGRSIIVAGLAPRFNSVFFMDLFQAIAHRIEARGLRLHICGYDGAQTCLNMLEDFAARKSAGAVIVPPAGKDWTIPRPILASMPVVSLLHAPPVRGIHSVHPDEVRTGRDATRGLIERGHRRVLMVDYAGDQPAVLQRARGYEQTMTRRGLQPIRLIKPQTDALIDTINAYRITAIFCHNDWLALETIRQLNVGGIRVPQDVSVLGVDDSPTFTSLCDEVTTMHYPSQDIATHVAAILDGTPLPRRVKPCTWVERKSVRTATQNMNENLLTPAPTDEASG